MKMFFWPQGQKRTRSLRSLGLASLSTDHYISGQGGIADAVLLLVCEIWRKRHPAHCKYGVCPLLQASARARMHGDEATSDGIVAWCWCCCGLWLHARTPTLLWEEERYTRYIRRGTQLLQATPAVAFWPLTETAQAPTNKHTWPNNTAGIHRRTSIAWWAICGGDCPGFVFAQFFVFPYLVLSNKKFEHGNEKPSKYFALCSISKLWKCFLFVHFFLFFWKKKGVKFMKSWSIRTARSYRRTFCLNFHVFSRNYLYFRFFFLILTLECGAFRIFCPLFFHIFVFFLKNYRGKIGKKLLDNNGRKSNKTQRFYWAVRPPCLGHGNFFSTVWPFCATKYWSFLFFVCWFVFALCRFILRFIS